MRYTEKYNFSVHDYEVRIYRFFRVFPFLDLFLNPVFRIIWPLEVSTSFLVPPELDFYKFFDIDLVTLRFSSMSTFVAIFASILLVKRLGELLFISICIISFGILSLCEYVWPDTLFSSLVRYGQNKCLYENWINHYLARFLGLSSSLSSQVSRFEVSDVSSESVVDFVAVLFLEKI